MKPFVPGQELQIGIYRKGKPVKQERKTIERKEGANAGIVKLKSPRFIKPGKFSARAVKDETDEQKGAAKSSKRFGSSTRSSAATTTVRSSSSSTACLPRRATATRPTARTSTTPPAARSTPSAR